MTKKLLYVVGGIAIALLMMPGVSNAAEAVKGVFINNDASHPVPTQAQGTTQVGGSVNVSGSVDVSTGPEARTRYKETKFFNESAQTCTQFVCTVTFPAVPTGKRLVVTYASARYGLSPGGTVPNVRLSDGTSVTTGDSIMLSAPVNIGFDTWVAAGPVTFYVEAGQTPTMDLGGQYVQPASLTCEVAISGYLVPAS